MAYPVLLYTSEQETRPISVWDKVVKNHFAKWGGCCKNFVYVNQCHVPASHDLGDNWKRNGWKISF